MSTGQHKQQEVSGIWSLVADVGGTNARLALADGQQIVQHRVYPCAQYPDLAAVIKDYRQWSGVAFEQASVAIANPVTGDHIQMTNHSWQFSIEATRQALSLKRLLVLNDFTALALSLPHLRADERQQIGGGQAIAEQTLGLIGPGTGLGVSGLVYGAGHWYPLASEGGHATFVATDLRQQQVKDFLAQRFGHVSFERVVSGSGLAFIYQALAQADGLSRPELSPAQISDAALSAQDPLAVEALQLFCRALGTAAGNLALTLGARGGVYIGGGIIPRLGEFFERSGFRQAFEAKGRFEGYLSAIPTWIITAEFPALTGAYAALAD